MRLAWLRRSSRAVAVFLLLTSLWQLPHRAQDDEICAPGAAEHHDESKHVFTTADALTHPDHCAICHWLRSLNPVFSSGAAVAVPLVPGGRLASAGTRDVADSRGDRLPARAPPARPFA